jgi:hypothetical protein
VVAIAPNYAVLFHLRRQNCHNAESASNTNKGVFFALSWICLYAIAPETTEKLIPTYRAATATVDATVKKLEAVTME